MIQRGIATFGLDFGKCPRWLFERMVRLGREMLRVIVAEEGPDAFIKRIADPVWFQSLGTVLAFDWNASGLTTILTAALKEAIRNEEKDLGVFICGGKGKTSRKTPEEIQEWGGRLALPVERTNNLVYNSKMAAKVDNALVQDGFQIYHHSFFFTKNGAWTVVQQGMNIANQTARRYHWHSASAKDLVCEPHTGIASQLKFKNVLNMTAQKSEETRAFSTELVSQSFLTLMKDIQLLRKYYTPVSRMAEIADSSGQQRLKLLYLENKEFKWHPVVQENFSQSRYLEKILWELCDHQPENYEKLLAEKGVGPKTVRALALVAEIIYGAKPSYEDPARYSFAHGGKDGTPYPVDRRTYDQTIYTMQRFVAKTRLPFSEKQKIGSRLAKNL
ncbi:MAG: DUF763 domain-containing protein [Candidatus Nealsonbacteria bacterium CG08_land_8_20_14_0_20_43_11]|uniref:DUF763 domain-containing protein n=1 Tax=Candidatus Nealsonbacteria bacterium CG08_land_8_20_14_0_20_43_11 TaxID=1974706 RepID=A0A2M6T0C8_9BACT|nr:MAG: DUF763 domain-containing protein [Candidatus Nealsonbacteria bacterium CG08_land_8_20_14_0_20_43_11]